MPELKKLYEISNKERFTFWRENLLEAQKFWGKVNPNNVELSDWRDADASELSEAEVEDYAAAPSCGTICCFGGWLPWSPYFAAMGVHPLRQSGAPAIGEGGSEETGSGVARYLFGTGYLFEVARSDEAVTHSTDYDIVAARIRDRLAAVDRALVELADL